MVIYKPIKWCRLPKESLSAVTWTAGLIILSVCHLPGPWIASRCAKTQNPCSSAPSWQRANEKSPRVHVIAHLAGPRVQPMGGTERGHVTWQDKWERLSAVSWLCCLRDCAHSAPWRFLGTAISALRRFSSAFTFLLSALLVNLCLAPPHFSDEVRHFKTRNPFKIMVYCCLFVYRVEINASVASLSGLFVVYFLFKWCHRVTLLIFILPVPYSNFPEHAKMMP